MTSRLATSYSVLVTSAYYSMEVRSKKENIETEVKRVGFFACFFSLLLRKYASVVVC